MQEALKAGALRRKDLFVTTKLWTANHRPGWVGSAFDASRQRLQLDYIDCYLIHTRFAFQPGDELGRVIYDTGVTLVETWRALERSLDKGTASRSDITIEKLHEIVATATIKRSMV